VRRVLIVDAALPIRTGIASLLRDHGIADVVAVLDHDAALAWTGDPSQVDLLIVGATDPRHRNDQVRGPAVCTAFRRHRPVGSSSIVAVAVDGRDDRARRRMWEAEADALVAITDLHDLPALERIVSDPRERYALTFPRMTESMRMLGIERSSRINRFVERVLEVGVEYLSHEAPDGAPPMRSRWWINLRRDLTETGRLRVVNRDGTAPDRNQRIASLAQLRRVYDWATRL